MPYNYPDTVRLAINAANARTPRLQPSAVREYGEMISKEVANGDWHLLDGVPVNPAGQNVEESLDFVVSSRPHWEVPATVVDAADDTWTSGNLSKQGKRYKELKAFLGSDAATIAAINAEAALYGTQMGSTKPGIKPGTKPDKIGDDGSPSPFTNPWSKQFKGSHEEAIAQQGRIIKSGSKLAENLARAAGVSIFGRPLK
jgi:hypothetical protein